MSKKLQATNAAVRTACGKRLTAADYRELMNLHTVPEVTAYLKETDRYRDDLQGLEPAYTHRGYLETLLRRSALTQCLHLCGLENLQKTPFFRFFTLDYEVRELMKKIQLMPEGSQAYISEMDARLGPYLAFSQERLVRAETYAEVIEAVGQNPQCSDYKAVLRRYLREGEPVDLTACEIALRAAGLNRIRQEAAASLDGADRDALLRLVGEQVDLINLINAYRLKKVFHADEKSLRSMMLPVAGRLPQRRLDAIYEAPDLNAFLEALRATRYGRIMGSLNGTADRAESVQLELAFQTMRCRSARRALHFAGHAAVSLYALLVLSQIEVRNLTTIIEGIRYEKSVDEMQALLILE